ncbi:hypothetical protein B0O80DRAFT_429600 [Mortierella sp. GBAus27b]|nr:hypothetical protein B0O80DRAFT_429600 [Mortierella sp. GBAus27b]
MSIGTAFRAPTIAKLALRLVESETTQDESYHVLLPIKTHGSRVPLFCIHPVLGLSWCFMGLYRSISTPNSLSMVYKRVDSTVKEGLPRPSMEWRWITLIRFAVSSHMDLTICLSTRSVARSYKAVFSRGAKMITKNNGELPMFNGDLLLLRATEAQDTSASGEIELIKPEHLEAIGQILARKLDQYVV